jgi:hypothetical protein
LLWRMLRHRADFEWRPEVELAAFSSLQEALRESRLTRPTGPDKDYKGPSGLGRSVLRRPDPGLAFSLLR